MRAPGTRWNRAKDHSARDFGDTRGFEPEIWDCVTEVSDLAIMVVGISSSEYLFKQLIAISG